MKRALRKIIAQAQAKEDADHRRRCKRVVRAINAVDHRFYEEELRTLEEKSLSAHTAASCLIMSRPADWISVG